MSCKIVSGCKAPRAFKMYVCRLAQNAECLVNPKHLLEGSVNFSEVSDNDQLVILHLVKLIFKENIQHVKCHLWLVPWYHVPSLVYLHEAEAIRGAQTSCWLVLAAASVRLIFCGIKIRLVRPLKCQGPLLVSEPVADVIHISC